MATSLLTLLEKYNVPGPRYTSYPTVPAWSEQVGVELFEQSLQSLRAGEKLSLYFHLPFCERLCHFCGCMQMITKDHARSREYLEILKKEIQKSIQFIPTTARELSQLHFGGGTPNFFQPEELAEIVGEVKKHFAFSPDAELAIEMHPRTSTHAFCDKLRELNFNRISLGVQDFDPVVQKLIHRDQTYEMTVAMIDYLKNLGFNSFNFDLIYGLPGQTLSGWAKTLNLVLGLKPNRLAVYSYAHVPWVRPVQRSFKDSDLPSPELKLELFAKAYETFTQGGYELIGMDHFALACDELAKAKRNGSLHRNFMGYSTRADAHQIGFGVSSISYVGGNYFQNAKDLKKYDQQIQARGLATFRGFILKPDDTLRRDLITQIMCHGGVNLLKFGKKWQIQFEDYFASELLNLKAFVQEGLLEINDRQMKIKDLGHLFLRNMAMVFDQYLAGIKKDAKTPVFSRTV